MFTSVIATPGTHTETRLSLKQSFQWETSAVTDLEAPPSARRAQLLDLAYEYALAHGLGELSLRPLATAIGSSPRVLLFLFGSKDALVRALLARARADELVMLDQLAAGPPGGDPLLAAADRVWDWLARPEHRALLGLWVEAYARSVIDPDGPWAGFARETVADWLRVLAAAQPAPARRTRSGEARRTLVLTILRGGLLDLLATGHVARTSAAVRLGLQSLST
jgi:AcrR family transcriptional regulator